VTQPLRARPLRARFEHEPPSLRRILLWDAIWALVSFVVTTLVYLGMLEVTFLQLLEGLREELMNSQRYTLPSFLGYALLGAMVRPATRVALLAAEGPPVLAASAVAVLGLAFVLQLPGMYSAVSGLIDLTSPATYPPSGLPLRWWLLLSLPNLAWGVFIIVLALVTSIGALHQHARRVEREVS